MLPPYTTDLYFALAKYNWCEAAKRGVALIMTQKLLYVGISVQWMGGKGSSMNNMLTIVWISWWMLGTYSGSDYGVLEIRKILGSAAVHLDSGIHRKRRSFVFVRKHVSICGSFAAGEFSERVRIWSYRLQTPNILLNRSHHFLAICIK